MQGGSSNGIEGSSRQGESGRWPTIQPGDRVSREKIRHPRGTRVPEMRRPDGLAHVVGREDRHVVLGVLPLPEVLLDHHHVLSRDPGQAAWRNSVRPSRSPCRPTAISDGLLSIARLASQFRRPLPCPDRPVDHPEKSVGAGLRNRLPKSRQIRGPVLERSEQVVPFGQQQPARLGDRRVRAAAANLPSVEVVPAEARFVGNSRQVGVDRRQRVAGGAKPRELRMVPVSARASGQHGSGQQGLSPESDQPLGVQVPRM